VFVTEGDDAHGKQGDSQSHTVVKTQTERDNIGGPVLVVLGEVSELSVGTIYSDDELGKCSGSQDVCHDEGDVNMLPKYG